MELAAYVRKASFQLGGYFDFFPVFNHCSWADIVGEFPSFIPVSPEECPRGAAPQGQSGTAHPWVTGQESCRAESSGPRCPGH